MFNVVPYKNQPKLSQIIEEVEYENNSLFCNSPTGFEADSNMGDFIPQRKQITYVLNIDDNDIVKYSLGGFILGQKGALMQEFVQPINETN